MRLPSLTNLTFRGLAAALLATSPLGAQDIQGPTDVAPRRINLAGAIEVPLHMAGTAPSALPTVDIMINGRGPFRFGVETGAGFVGIHPRLAESLGLQRTGGSDQLPGYRLDSLRIGGARFDQVPVYALATAATNIEGILGLPLFAELLMTVDYPGRVLKLARGRLPAADGQTVLALARVGPFWALPIRIGGSTMNAVIDTRSSGGLGFTSDSGLRFTEPPVVVGMARGAAIAPVQVRAGRLADTVSIGRWRIPNPRVSLRPLPPGFPTEPIVGTLVLQNFAVTLDQAGRRVQLARPGDAILTLPEVMPQRQVQVAGPPPAPTTGAAAPAADPALLLLTGVYGIRTITAEGGTLYIQRQGGPRLRLVPRDVPDEYGLEEIAAARIRFVRGPDRRAHTLEVLNPQGEWERASRP